MLKACFYAFMFMALIIYLNFNVMKKLFKLVVLLSFAFIFGACKKDSSFFYQNNSEMNLTLQNERLDAGIYFAIGTTLPINSNLIHYAGTKPIIQESWAVAVEWHITKKVYQSLGISNY